MDRFNEVADFIMRSYPNCMTAEMARRLSASNFSFVIKDVMDKIKCACDKGRFEIIYTIPDGTPLSCLTRYLNDLGYETKMNSSLSINISWK